MTANVFLLLKSYTSSPLCHFY
uniref:Uncharacterized protein n=1 Tax=Anguilla anguilla TaxID=7936 RepID=A0A0E9TBW1_ANGAN